jgi:hypothetical protein
MLRFVSRLAVCGEGAYSAMHRAVLAAALPEVLSALCTALASKEYLADINNLVPAAEVLYALALAFPAELPPAIGTGLQRVQVPAWSRERLQRHVAGRAEWHRTGEWLEHLQQIVQEWQRELRHVQL